MIFLNLAIRNSTNVLIDPLTAAQWLFLLPYNMYQVGDMLLYFISFLAFTFCSLVLILWLSEFDVLAIRVFQSDCQY